jgi:hypothetical protein
VATGKVIKLGILLELLDKVTGPAGKISKSLRDVEKATKQADRAVEMAKKNWSTGWKMTAAGAAMAAPFIYLGDQIVKTGVELANLRRMADQAMGGDAVKGLKLFEYVAQFEDLTPFEKMPLMEAATLLQRMGMDAQKWLPRLTDVAVVTGKLPAEIASMFARAKAMGTARSLYELGIGKPQLIKAGLKGGLDDVMDQAKMTRLLWNVSGNNMFSWATSKAMEGPAGLWKRMGEAWEKLREGAAGIEFPKLMGELRKIVAIVESPAFQNGIQRWAKIAADSFGLVLDWAGKLLKPVIAIILWIDKLAQKHPDLMKYVIAFSFMATGAIIALGAIHMLTAGLIWCLVPLLKLRVFFAAGGAFDTIRIVMMYAGDSMKIFGGAVVTVIRAIGAAGLSLLTNPIFLAIAAIAVGAYLIIRYWEPIKGFFAGIGQWIAKHIKVIVNVLLYLLGPIGWVIMAFRNWNTIGPIVMGVVNKVIGWFGAMINWIAALPGRMWNAGRNIVLSIWEGIKSVAMWPVNAIRDIAQRIRNLWPFSPAKEGPLRNLSQAGQGITEQIVYGIERGTGRLKAATMAAGTVAALGLYSPFIQQGDIAIPLVPQAFAMTQNIKTPGPIANLDLMSFHAPLSGPQGFQFGGANNYGVKPRGPEAGGTWGMDDLGGGGMGDMGAMDAKPSVYYITMHFEQNSIRLEGDIKDFDSFVDKVGKKMVKNLTMESKP